MCYPKLVFFAKADIANKCSRFAIVHNIAVARRSPDGANFGFCIVFYCIETPPAPPL